MKIPALLLILLGYTVIYAGFSRALGSKYKNNTIIALLGFNAQTAQGTVLGQTEFFQDTGTGQPGSASLAGDISGPANGITTTSQSVNP